MTETKQIYTLHKSKINIEGIIYDTYGIRYGDNIFADISTDKESVVKLIERINKAELSYIHLKDVIEDFLV